MNIRTYKKTNYILLLLLFSTLFSSCKENIPSVGLLQQAQKTVEANPTRALALLDSISKPESMDTGDYMQYIVTRVQAKYKLYEDVTGDTLIFEAQKYFDNKKDPDQAALANIYTGMVYREKDMPDEALKCYLQSIQDAKKTDNNLLIARSLHNIGNVYYGQGIMNNVIVHSKEALNYYDKAEGTDLNKIELMNLIGNAYREIDNKDSTCHYFKKGLDKAQEIQNKEYQAIFTRNLGVAYRDRGNYREATKLFYKVLPLTTNTEDSIRLYLNLSKLYNAKHQLDSANHYIGLIKNRLSDITYIKTLSSAYGSLADYNKQCGNFEEAFHYLDMQKATNKKISDSNHAQQLLEMDNRFKLSLVDKELKNQQFRLYVFIAVAALLFLFFVAISYIRVRNMRRQHQHEKDILEAKHKLLKAEYDSANLEIESLIFMQNNYQTILHEWTDIELKAERYVKKHEGKEMPEIHLLIKDLKEDVRQTTNRQLTEWAKSFLQKQPSGGKAISVLDDSELILLVLSYCRYATKDIAIILGTPLKQKDIDKNKLNIKDKLLNAGLSDSFIDELLFGEERSLEFQV